MSFKEKKYLVLKKVITKEIADFAWAYLFLKRKVAQTLFARQWIHPYEEIHGYFLDDQVPNTFSIYGDVAMEILLLELLPIMKEKTELDLVPTYSYARIYKKGDVLERHKDRPSCEISTTLNLGGDAWPIYIDPNPENGFDIEEGVYKPGNKTGEEIILEPGDMLIYRGCDLEHWREKFEGEKCGQVFLHYNINNKDSIKFDNRPHLGLPKELTTE
jgi:hypothetical protein|tara:strand:- start:1149 stop:1796 length:648 start_codon:yes stop_codon:yes gene_type:complete